MDAGIARRPRASPSASTCDCHLPSRAAAARRGATALDPRTARQPGARDRRGARRSIQRVGGDDPRRPRSARRIRGPGALARRRDPPPGRSRTCRIAVKEALHHREKVRIGRSAAALVRDGDTIILDSGTTTAEIARHLRTLGLQSVTVITNGLNIAMTLASVPQIRVIMIGGHAASDVVLGRRTAGRADAPRALRGPSVPRRRRPRPRRRADHARRARGAAECPDDPRLARGDRGRRLEQVPAPEPLGHRRPRRRAPHHHGRQGESRCSSRACADATSK